MDRASPNWSWANESACYDLLEYLDKFSVVDPVKHGKWLDGCDDDGIHFKYCSECGSVMPYVIHSAYSEGEWVEAADCCWHCSAKMDGENNG